MGAAAPGLGDQPRGTGVGAAVHTTAVARGKSLSVHGLGAAPGAVREPAPAGLGWPSCVRQRTESSVEGCAAWVLWEPFL